MAHPYYNRANRKPEAFPIWTVLTVLLILIIGLPWVLPDEMAHKMPFSMIRNIFTFNMEYEWHHTTSTHDASQTGLDKASTDSKSDSTTSQSVYPNVMATDDSWFPLAVGNRWVFQHTKKGGMMNPDEAIVSEKVIEIVAKKETHRVTVFEVKITDNDDSKIVYYFRDEEGLKMSRDMRFPTRRPLLLLKEPLDVGVSWYESIPGSPKSTVNAIEDFSTPAGTFNCAYVETVYMKSEDRVYKTWYAKNIGIVMQVTGSTARGEDEWLLKEFKLN